MHGDIFHLEYGHSCERFIVDESTLYWRGSAILGQQGRVYVEPQRWIKPAQNIGGYGSSERRSDQGIGGIVLSI